MAESERVEARPSHNHTITLAFASFSSLLLWENHCLDGLVEYELEALLCQCRAFHVTNGLDISSHLLSLLGTDGMLFVGQHFIDNFLVVLQVGLGAHEEDLGIRTVMADFGIPLQMVLVGGSNGKGKT